MFDSIDFEKFPHTQKRTDRPTFGPIEATCCRLKKGGKVCKWDHNNNLWVNSVLSVVGPQQYFLGKNEVFLESFKLTIWD